MSSRFKKLLCLQFQRDPGIPYIGRRPPTKGHGGGEERPGAGQGNVAMYVHKGLNFDKLETSPPPPRPVARTDTRCGIRLYLNTSASKSSSSAPTADIHNPFSPRPPYSTRRRKSKDRPFRPSVLPTTRDAPLVGDWNAHYPDWDRPARRKMKRVGVWRSG